MLGLVDFEIIDDLGIFAKSGMVARFKEPGPLSVKVKVIGSPVFAFSGASLASK